jgi:putative addiction module killer protein
MQPGLKSPFFTDDYFKQTGKSVVLLLCGGDKSTQEKDIKRAKQIAAEL